MKKKSSFALLALVIGFLFSINYSMAQQNLSKYAVEVKLDKKIIHPDSLNFPNGTSITTVLYMLPEMLNRIGEPSYFNNYEIQIEDVSVEESKDLILTNIKIEDVKEIEIIESPIASYENNGQGGTINITLKDVTEKPSGYISSSYSNFNYLSPVAYFGIKHKKLDFKFLTSFDYYDPNPNKSFIATDTNPDEKIKLNNLFSVTQMARLYIKYRASQKDILTFCISENYSRRNESSYFDDISIETSTTEEKIKKVTLRANTKYEHIFNNAAKLTAEVNYNYSPSNKYTTVNIMTYDNDIKNHTLGGKVEYAIPLSKKVTLSGGLNYNISDVTDYTLNNDIHYYRDAETLGDEYYISPYIKLECQFGKFTLKSNTEYQYHQYQIKSNHELEYYNTKRNNLTGKLSFGYQFNDHNHVRLVLDKKLKRPLREQMYPFFVYSSAYEQYMLGNSSLRPIISNEIKLEYITDITTKRNTKMIFDCSVCYIRTDDIIQDISVPLLPYPYLTFSNKGNNDCFNGNLMFYLKKGIFSLSTSFNVYFDKDYSDGEKDYNSYYQFSLMPSINLNNGWMALAQLIYNSTITNQNTQLGSCTNGRLSIGKCWKHIQLFAYGYIDLNGRVTDYKYNHEKMQVISTTHYLSIPTVGISAKFIL